MDENVMENRSETKSNPQEFDWKAFERGDYIYGEYLEKIETTDDQPSTKVNENEVVEGTVSAISKREVLVNIGYKSEGVIAAPEFRYNPELKVGDKVEVYVESTEDRKGQLILSHKKARQLRSWDMVNKAFDNAEVVKGYVKTRTKGGMIVDVFGIEAFLPGSQIDTKPISNFDAYVDQTMDFKIVKINHEFRCIVVSHVAVLDENYSEQNIKDEDIVYEKLEDELWEDIDKEDWDEEAEIDERYEYAYNNPPPLSAMPYTNGSYSSCPNCGSHNVETYYDGTALCRSCYKWYRYA